MINDLQFSTNPSLLVKGGLFICGMNWGGNSVDPGIEEASEPWAPYFSHPSNASRYQTCLLKWFDLWGWKLNSTEPTLLDLAILQTNLFFTQSRRFHDELDEDQWWLAFQRLCVGIIHYNISGLLITSKEVGDQFIEFSKNSTVPEWDRAVGSSPSWSQRGNDTLCLVIGKTNVLNIAIMNHPASGVSDQDVESQDNKSAMSSWISEVMQGYKRKQSRKITEGDPAHEPE